MIKENTWNQIEIILSEAIPEKEYDIWLRPLSGQVMDNKLIITAPNRFFCQRINDHYKGVITKACEHIYNKKMDIEFKIDLNGNFSNHAHLQNQHYSEFIFKPFNDRYIFSSFIVGPSNELAYAACHAAANNPGILYNPLFIFGDSGLGKTHLLTAVGHFLKQHKPLVKTCYNTIESFTNELNQAIVGDTLNRFRNKYRKLDCLLLDDIQLLAGNDRTQEELFHTFNALYDNGKQIIVTSDKKPKDIPSLEKRLRTRFEWGLLADLQLPEEETRVSIVQEKSKQMGLPLSKSAALYLAKQPESSIRVLEGYLTRIQAVSRLKNLEPTLELVRTVIKPLVDQNPIAPEDVLRVVSSHFAVKVADLKSKKKTRDITLPRQIAMYLIRKLTGASFPEIGRIMGGKDHSTVVKGVKKIEILIANDSETNEKIMLVEKALLGRDSF
ncbi:chromosomal replication initiator protein DnaA [Dethiosulfatarculus sandiegensis]|uniref:chromosomal replication initiator protein DnaA n=1 Tax=Dethiosulfatarculus sandiegensis TaxID=1429043 RepID=UPI0006965C59|nr:chromosomal replication initiator protein DnaA [Dethiosulfatarculus sandiegensis]